MSLINKLKNAISSTSESIGNSISRIINRRYLDDNLLFQLEESLLAADIGAKNVEEIISTIKKINFDGKLDTKEVMQEIVNTLSAKLQVSDCNSIFLPQKDALNVIVVCGVNGNGKTTTVAKLAHYYNSIGIDVSLAACDTFRAAAREQLEIWAKRLNVHITIGEDRSDPASVAYKAIDHAKKNSINVLLIDTAGRLHNQANLMDELAKITKIVKRANPLGQSRHLMVLDATTGQGAINQAELFNKHIKIDNVVVTKLDGTAKAGTVFHIVEKLRIPICFVGTGEKINDLAKFDPYTFVAAIVNG